MKILWQDLTSFVLKDYLTKHFDPTNPYQCDICPTKEILKLKAKIDEDFGPKRATHFNAGPKLTVEARKSLKDTRCTRLKRSNAEMCV